MMLSSFMSTKLRRAIRCEHGGTSEARMARSDMTWREVEEARDSEGVPGDEGQEEAAEYFGRLS